MSYIFHGIILFASYLCSMPHSPSFSLSPYSPDSCNTLSEHWPPQISLTNFDFTPPHSPGPYPFSTLKTCTMASFIEKFLLETEKFVSETFRMTFLVFSSRNFPLPLRGFCIFCVVLNIMLIVLLPKSWTLFFPCQSPKIEKYYWGSRKELIDGIFYIQPTPFSA